MTCATRETAELTDEDIRLGAALARLLGSLDLLPEEGHRTPGRPRLRHLVCLGRHLRQLPVRQTL